MKPPAAQKASSAARKVDAVRTRIHKEHQQFWDQSAKKWVYTHVRVVEKMIGGKIWKGFVVHHRDGNKLNNRGANLDLVTRAIHWRIHHQGLPNRPFKKAAKP